MSTEGAINLLTDPAAFAALAPRLARQRRIALDTEAASFHRYVDRVYLVQISTGPETFIVDPLALPDLSPLGRLLVDPSLEIVLHDADYDLRILDRDYGFRVRNLFDTRVAAQLVGEPGVGLGTLLARYFGVRLDKKLQRADWSQRPLTPEMLAYAAADTRHLLALRDLLASKLEQVARLDWASEEFRRLEDVRWTGTPPDDGDAYLRIRGAGTLRDPRARAILKALYEWRDAAARKADRAPFRVIGNDALLAVARAAPRDQRALEAVPGLPRSLARRHGSGLLDAVANGMAVPNDRLPVVRRTLRHPADPAYDQRLERLKSLRNARAGESGMDPGLLCPNATLQALARAIPSSPADIDGVMELRSWQRRLLGDRAILTAVAG